MLVSKYKDEGYLFNVNLTGSLGQDEVYRGDLVLVFGEVTERGDRKPPTKVARQAVLYVADDKINLFVAGLNNLSDLDLVTEHYDKDFAEDSKFLFFVRDIKDPMVVPSQGSQYVVVPLEDGMIWNEALELLCIEKSDLKGQSAEEKIGTLLDELKSFKPKYDEVAMADALERTIEVKGEARGPV